MHHCTSLQHTSYTHTPTWEITEFPSKVLIDLCWEGSNVTFYSDQNQNKAFFGEGRSLNCQACIPTPPGKLGRRPEHPSACLRPPWLQVAGGALLWQLRALSLWADPRLWHFTPRDARPLDHRPCSHRSASHTRGANRATVKCLSFLVALILFVLTAQGLPGASSPLRAPRVRNLPPQQVRCEWSERNPLPRSPARLPRSWGGTPGPPALLLSVNYCASPELDHPLEK